MPRLYSVDCRRRYPRQTECNDAWSCFFFLPSHKKGVDALTYIFLWGSRGNIVLDDAYLHSPWRIRNNTCHHQRRCSTHTARLLRFSSSSCVVYVCSLSLSLDWIAVGMTFVIQIYIKSYREMIEFARKSRWSSLVELNDWAGKSSYRELGRIAYIYTWRESIQQNKQYHPSSSVIHVSVGQWANITSPNYNNKKSKRLFFYPPDWLIYICGGLDWWQVMILHIYIQGWLSLMVDSVQIAGTATFPMAIRITVDLREMRILRWDFASSANSSGIEPRLPTSRSRASKKVNELSPLMSIAWNLESKKKLNFNLYGSKKWF